MRIVILSTYPPAHCGIGTYTSYLSSGLKKLKNTKIYILTEKSNPKILSKNISVVPCFDREKEYANDILQKIKQVKPDIVHIEHEFGIFGWDKRLIKLLSKMKSIGCHLVITIHTVYSYKSPLPYSAPKYVNIENYYLKVSRIVDNIIIHQKECKEVLIRIGLDKRKISVIPHGTLISKIKKEKKIRKRLGLKQNAKIIMYFGFFKDSKLTLSFIEALPIIFKEIPNSYFYMIGSFRIKETKDFKYMEEIKSKIKKLNIEERVILMNKYIVEGEVPLYLASADIVVYPYDMSHWGDTGSAHRAIGAGTLTTISRIPKFDEIRSEICEEIAVLPHKSGDWARVIIRILKDKKFRNYIAKKTKAYAKKTSWDNISKQHFKLYKALTKKEKTI